MLGFGSGDSRRANRIDIDVEPSPQNDIRIGSGVLRSSLQAIACACEQGFIKSIQDDVDAGSPTRQRAQSFTNCVRVFEVEVTGVDDACTLCRSPYIESTDFNDFTWLKQQSD